MTINNKLCGLCRTLGGHRTDCPTLDVPEHPRGVPSNPTASEFMAMEQNYLYCPPDPERLTLRDQFAMAALTGLLSGLRSTKQFTDIGQVCYGVADLMMVERAKGDKADEGRAK